MPAELVKESTDARVDRQGRDNDKPPREIKLVQIISQSFKNASGDVRFNIYGLGADGAVYRKAGNRGEGWVRMNMTIEYYEDDRNKE